MEPLQEASATESTTLGDKPKTSYGVLIALIIIVAVIVVGAFYLLKERLGEGLTEDTSQNEMLIENMRTQGTASDPVSIEGDLNAQSVEDFERALDEAYAEFDASVTP